MSTSYNRCLCVALAASLPPRTDAGCDWTLYPNTNIIWGQVRGPSEGQASGCETGNDHPCWAVQQVCAACAPVLPPHTFVELGKVPTFDACMKLADEGWGDWPAAGGDRPSSGCVTVRCSPPLLSQ